jgi:RNA polymerase sigma factor (sigma-70 family)
LASDPVPGGEHGRSTIPAEAAGLLYERYRDRVFGYCLYMLGNRDEADDATQTTFLHAFRALRRGVVPAVETAWLLKIAENVCLSWRRSAARRRRVETPTDVVELQEVVPARERGADELIGLEDALAEMPPAQRRAILLREWQGLSYREIGERLRLSQAAVETLLFRARRTLAQNLSMPQTTRGRVARALDFGGLVGAIKSAFAGASAVKVAATIAAVATATAVAGSEALGDREPVDKESQKEVDVVVAREGVDLGRPSFQSAERMAVSRGRPAPGERPKAATAKQRKADAAKDERGTSEPTASPQAGSDGNSSPSAGKTSPSGPGLVPLSPPSLSPPSLAPPGPPAPQVPVKPPSLPSLDPPSLNPPSLPPLNPPSLPLNPPSLPLNPPALPSLPLP